METEHDAGLLIPISALEHFSYCPRQCALIHLEQTFDENIYTLKGRMLHERVHSDEEELREGVRIERAVPLWSNRLGLVGKADVVEFDGDTPYPVEYKHGPRRNWGHAELQVCAQAMCLEEMTGQPVPRGAIFFHGSRRRQEVVFTESLRQEVVRTVAAVREMLYGERSRTIAAGQLPPAPNDARCTHCSLKDSCLPEAAGEEERMSRLYQALFIPEPEEE